MSESNYQIVAFSSTEFNFLDKRLSKYAVIFFGKELSKDLIKEDLKRNVKNQNSDELARFFDRNKITSIGILKEKNVPYFEAELSIIEQKINLQSSHFAVLLDYEDPSIRRSSTNRPSEESFLISTDKFIQFFNQDINTGLCYHLILSAIDDKKGLTQILAHQLGHPHPSFDQKSAQQESAEVIIPHRGNMEDLSDLESSLWYLKQQNVAPKKVSVCFDEIVTDHHFKIVDELDDLRFFVNYPSGVGPYPSRDKLARATEEDVIVFHDSDDISTIDRIGILTNELKDKNLDALGSHELRVNKIEKRVEAIRFPLDVIGIENKQDWYSIFFPTTAIKKSAYLKTGGLSTVRRHSSDSQFYWRAHFFLNMKNVDEFLYIRIKRENSLTTASSTALGTTVRERLRRQWRTDYLKVRNRNISLNESTLLDEYNVAEINLISLEKENRKMILDWQELNKEMQKSSLKGEETAPVFPDEKDILEDRILEYKLIKDPGVAELKKSFSWRIGWTITRGIKVLFGWIPFVRKQM